MNTVSVRPRLDLSYDVIQNVAPQLVGVRRERAAAIALGEWAAKRIAPCRLTVFGPDGATVVEAKDVAGDGQKPASAAAH